MTRAPRSRASCETSQPTAPLELHEHRVALGDADRLERVHRGRAVGEQSRRLDERPARGLPEQQRGLHRELRRLRAPQLVAVDLVADRELLALETHGIRPRRCDHPGRLVAESHGKLRRVGARRAARLLRVPPVQGRRPHGDRHLVGLGSA
jgi:hypothetical protein